MVLFLFELGKEVRELQQLEMYTDLTRRFNNNSCDSYYIYGQRERSGLCEAGLFKGTRNDQKNNVIIQLVYVKEQTMKRFKKF